MTQESIDVLMDLISYDELFEIDSEHDYFKRFPSCANVTTVRYKDGSVTTKCLHGAYGEASGEASTIPWDACVKCTHFKLK